MLLRSGGGALNLGCFGVADSRNLVVRCTGSLSNSGMTCLPKTSRISSVSSWLAAPPGTPNTSWSTPMN